MRRPLDYAANWELDDADRDALEGIVATDCALVLGRDLLSHKPEPQTDRAYAIWAAAAERLGVTLGIRQFLDRPIDRFQPLLHFN